MIEDNALFLSLLRQRPKVLLLYDGADDLDLVQQILPPDTMPVHVLVTTRCGGDHPLFDRANGVIRLGYLSPEKAVSALFAWARRRNPSDDELEYAMKMVANSFIQGLPLAVAHIGTFLRQAKMACSAYYEMLMSRQEELQAAALDLDKLLQYFHISTVKGKLAAVGVSHPQHLQALSPAVIQDVVDNPVEKQRIMSAQFWMNESNHIYLTWQFDIDTVNQSRPDAMRVLAFASLLSSRNIPGYILQALAFPKSGSRSRYQFSLAMTELSAHTLVSMVESNEADNYSVDVHGLVQSTVLQRLIRDPLDLQQKLISLSQWLLENIPLEGHIRNSLRDNTFLVLIPHVYKVAEHILELGVQDNVCFHLVDIACETALESCHVDAAAYLCEKLLQVVESWWESSEKSNSVERLVRGKCDNVIL